MGEDKKLEDISEASLTLLHTKNHGERPLDDPESISSSSLETITSSSSSNALSSSSSNAFSHDWEEEGETEDLGTGQITKSLLGVSEQRFKQKPVVRK